MKNKACIIILLLLSSINENTFAKGIEESADRNILNLILKNYLKVYESYQGLKSKQNVCMKVINPDTDKIVKTEEIEMIRDDFFYKKPVVTIKRYIVNGEIKDPKDCKIMKKAPLYQVFDKN